MEKIFGQLLVLSRCITENTFNQHPSLQKQHGGRKRKNGQNGAVRKESLRDEQWRDQRRGVGPPPAAPRQPLPDWPTPAHAPSRTHTVRKQYLEQNHSVDTQRVLERSGRKAHVLAVNAERSLGMGRRRRRRRRLNVASTSEGRRTCTNSTPTTTPHAASFSRYLRAHDHHADPSSDSSESPHESPWATPELYTTLVLKPDARLLTILHWTLQPSIQFAMERFIQLGLSIRGSRTRSIPEQSANSWAAARDTHLRIWIHDNYWPSTAMAAATPGTKITGTMGAIPNEIITALRGGTDDWEPLASQQ
ncbi:hypothetical protein BDK51DRAFT_39483 [Blyttiomyces helicus]|uniref:Uncharacterized protein n=1 Tax=Blyttiomyces helicus TaxID=388810 RepID=A0A4P9VX92_9FUNG|nr:hypothetical protein BDK51DRAFT_39483 [Blyttiomyces helicus]|eukprot:RKO82900.1 hypothetical protein BDK51DRAFT_39483 [Blyttiomyces helicus]